MSQASSHAQSESDSTAAQPVQPGQTATRDRLVAAVLLIACLALLGVAAGLTPDDRGFGTHESMGLPPCGFKAATDLPCATCGMTTSFSHATNGDLITAFTVQPAGTLLALGTAMLAVLSAGSLVFGFSLAPLGRLVSRPPFVLGLGAVLVAGWAYTLTIAIGT